MTQYHVSPCIFMYPKLFEGEDEEEEEEGDDEESDADDVLLISSLLRRVVSEMLNIDALTVAEAQALLEMIAMRNEYVFGAFELYQADKNVTDLQDTLIRCARLELRKQAVEHKESSLMRQKQQMSQIMQDAIDGNDDEEDEDDEDDVDMIVSCFIYCCCSVLII